ncbi:MAG: membrane biogenesis protein [Methylobacter sp.]|nr:MAG: membrane biogenesis protein [Methylobacter sp.]
MDSRHSALFILKTLAIIASIITLTAVIAVYSLPPLLTKQLPRLIEQKTGRQSSISAINIRLSPFSIGLHDFVIREKNGRPFIAFEELSVQLDLKRSFQQNALTINEISLKKPEIYLARQKEGVFNFQDLSQPDSEPKKDTGTVFPVNIDKLSVTEGKLVWEDAQSTPPWVETVAPMQFVAEGISSRISKPANLNLTFSLQSGGHVAWHSQLGLSPFSNQGRLEFDHLNLAKIIDRFAPKSGLSINGNNALAVDYDAKYAEDKLTLGVPKAILDLRDISYTQPGKYIKAADFKHETALAFVYSGQGWQLDAKTAKTQSNDLQAEDKLLGKLAQLNADASYQLSGSNGHLNLTINDGSLSIKGLGISDQTKSLASFPMAEVRGFQANLDKHTFKANALAIKDAAINAWLNADSTINYQALMAADKAPPPTTATPSPKADWQIDIGNIALDNCAINFEDRTLPKPTTLALNPIHLKLDGYSNSPATRLPFELSAGVNKNGLVALKGEVLLAPFSTKIATTVKNIDLEKFQPYYDQFIRLDIIDGMLNADGNLFLKQSAANPVDIQFNGNGSIDDLLIRDQRVHKDLLKWGKLSLNNMVVDVPSQRYTAGELVINKPYARVTIRKDKTVNFSNLLVNQENPGKTVTVQKKTDGNRPYFKLGKVQIIDGSSDFTDLSLFLPFSAHIKGLDGGASGVSSDKNSQIQVALKGNAYDLAPVDINGQISPYLGEYDTKINFNSLPMPLVSSYMVQFAGYKVEKGKMTLNLHYQIADKKLTASNRFLIDQFELGDRIDHPGTVSLPIKFAVALLKDDRGKIKIDVPVSGNLDSPQFNIRAVITDALTNTFSKIISSPFSALASLTRHEESNLSTIHFKAGNATLDKAEQAKLNEIAIALRARPQLMLDIKGSAIEGQDWPAISDDALYDQLKIRRADEINKENSRKIRPEYVEISNDDYHRLTADMFIEKFPLLAEKSLLGIPQLKNPKTGQQFYEVAKQKLQGIINPEQERLKELANDRARAIAKHLVQQAGIAQERIYILDSVVDTNKDTKEIASLLSLKVN